jgi:hydroxyacylglutathione hydrolase
MIEPRAELGLGLAYSTTSMQHLLNVPAGKLSALPETPNHFLDWVRVNYDGRATAADFIPRLIFGKYIQSLLAATPNIQHLQTTAIDCRVHDGTAHLDLTDGTRLRADVVILATGNFDPAPFPGVSEDVVASGAYGQSAWEEGTYANLPSEAPVALIGTGLTAVDVLLKLRESGHRGTVTAVSRHGVFPNRQQPYTPLPGCVIEGDAPTTARTLLQRVQQAIKQTGSWRAVIDSLRDRTNELWLTLPPAEQKRFRRHLLRRWEVVRHRMAPPIADRIDAELAAGTLVKEKGHVLAVLPASEGAALRIQNRHGNRQNIVAARVINCTGPDMDYRRVSSPLLTSLFRHGLAAPGPLGAGLWSGPDGALRAEDGIFSRVLFTVGPARLGTLLESIAVPELRQQAADLAATVAVMLQTKAESAAPAAVR